MADELGAINRTLGEVLGRIESLSVSLEAQTKMSYKREEKLFEELAEVRETMTQLPDSHGPEHEALRQIIEKQKLSNQIKQRVVTTLAQNFAKGLVLLVLLGLAVFIPDIQKLIK